MPIGIPYQFLFTAKHIYDAPLEELNLLTRIGDRELVDFYHNAKSTWRIGFGVQCIVSHAFLVEVCKQYPRVFGSFINSVKTRVDRMCCERLFAVIFNKIRPVSQYKFGDIFVYYNDTHGIKWGYSFKEYEEDIQKDFI